MKLFTLVADLTMDTSQFVSSIKSAKTEILGFDTTGSQAQAYALGQALYDVSAKAVEMAVNLGKTIYGEYADTEQLIGGVSTIFKEDAATVIENANNAFESAGMSANAYMENVIGFSTRLLQGLGGDTAMAAQYADMALTDMADNINKFGSSFGMVENAYMGFSRGNFTMLDNLRLGYGGTMEEMVRLINDSGVAVGMFVEETGELRDMGIDDLKTFPLYKMFEAIHVIQDNLGVTGTTAQEAADTLTGSTSAFEASLDNMLAGLANKDADIQQLRDNLIGTGETMLSNYAALVPVIVENTVAAIFGLSENAEDVAEDIQKEYASTWVEIQNTATAATALVNALSEFEEGGFTSDEKSQWDALVSSLSADLPLLSEAIGQNNGVIEQGSEALASYVEEWKNASIEIGQANAMAEYNEEIGRQQTTTAQAKVDMDAAFMLAQENEKLWNQVWLDAIDYVNLMFDPNWTGALASDVTDVLANPNLVSDYLLNLQEWGHGGDTQAQAYFDLLNGLQSSEDAWAKYEEASAKYEVEMSKLEALQSQQNVLLEAINAISSALTNQEPPVVEVTVNNTANDNLIVSKVEQRISRNARNKSFTVAVMK